MPIAESRRCRNRKAQEEFILSEAKKFGSSIFGSRVVEALCKRFRKHFGRRKSRKAMRALLRKHMRSVDNGGRGHRENVVSTPSLQRRNNGAVRH